MQKFLVRFRQGVLSSVWRWPAPLEGLWEVWSQFREAHSSNLTDKGLADRVCPLLPADNPMLSKTKSSRSGLLRGLRGEKAELRAKGTNLAFVTY